MLFYNQRLSTAVEDIIILQTQPSKRCKMKTVADPERRRWRFEITMRPVVPLSPLKGKIWGPRKTQFFGERSGNEAILAFYFYKTPISGVCHDEREQRRGRKAFLWQHKRRSAPSGRCSEAFTGAAVGLTQGDMPPRQDANGKSSTAVSLRQSKKWGYIIKTIPQSFLTASG